jgi:hypothetical protein
MQAKGLRVNNLTLDAPPARLELSDDEDAGMRRVHRGEGEESEDEVRPRPLPKQKLLAREFSIREHTELLRFSVLIEFNRV